jgi:choline/glycine/proline betaine transport protein
MVGVVAIVLLAAGGLSALQTMTIVAALPFSIVLLVSMVGLLKALKVESRKRESLQFSATQQCSGIDKEAWRERLESIVTFPNLKAVEHFLNNIVTDAFESVKSELMQYQLDVEITRKKRSVALIVRHGDEAEFIYGVHRRKYEQPDFAAGESDEESIDNDEEQSYYRAEVHLIEGGQDYDIMGWSKIAVINDVIDQYHKHQHFLHLLR